MNRINFATLICLSFFIIFTAAGQQNKQQIEELYKDANAYFYFEDYEEALALYLKVYNSYTDNFNLDYRIGFCYLNIPGQTSYCALSRKGIKNIAKHMATSPLRKCVLPWKHLPG